jgi:hypothetical protein
MTRAEVQTWLDGYIDAWRRNEPGPVRALFTEDAVYRFRPYGSRGRVAEGIGEIVDSWIDESAEPGQWDASYSVYAVDGDHAVAIGTSRYLATEDQPEKLYYNCFLLRFAPDGRCIEFTEYWMLDPGEG